MELDKNKPWVILSDIHANQPALEAVLNDINLSRKKYELIFLGDLFGYGPIPVGVSFRINRLQPDIWLAGNHDKYLANESINNGNINNGAKESLRIHKDLSTSGLLPLLDVCDRPVKFLDGHCLFSHGFPLEDDHLSVEAYDKDYHPSGKNGFITELWRSSWPLSRVWYTGHSHSQKVWWFQPETATWTLYPDEQNQNSPNSQFKVRVQGKEDRKLVRIQLPLTVLDTDLLIINPGSVGFPRNSIEKRAIANKIANYAKIHWQADAIVIELISVPYAGSAVVQGWRDGFYPVEELLKYF